MNKTLTVIAAAAWATTAFAQAEPPRVHRAEMIVMAAPGPEMDRDQVVQGAPYCADAVHETVQVLADGNRIVQRQNSRHCRDGQGRTRLEMSAGPRKQVVLRDPVAQENWLLDPEAKTAVPLGRGRHMMTLRGDGPDGAHRAVWERFVGYGKELRETVTREIRERFGHAPTPPAPPSAPAAGAAPQAPQPPEAATRVTRIVVNGTDVALPPPGPMPQNVAMQMRMLAPRGPGVVTMLPGETIEGLRADGRRTTWTVEAGRIGNEKPLVTVREVWTSPELGITLKSKDSDPVAGEEQYRVAGVSRAEPDAALFRVPADYRRIAAPQMLPLPPLPPAPPAPAAPVPRAP